MLTRYEIMKIVMEPLMPLLHPMVRQDLKRLAGHRKLLLDVGGRKSPYTVGLKMDVTIVDVPQQSDVQKQLNLGLTDEMLKKYSYNRSNIKGIHIEDMTQSTLPDQSYDAAVAVEVIEHVVQDDDFVRHTARVLKKDGWFYLTTPNGDYIKNEGPSYNPDHVKHFKKQELHNLLAKYFNDVEVWYAISTGKNRVRGLRSMYLSKPFELIGTMWGNIMNRPESKNLREQSSHTAHLFALARNPK